MPDIRLYLDNEHWNKHQKLSEDKKSEINAKARQLIYKELDKLPR